MIMSTITLIKDSPEAHGVFDAIETSQKVLKCRVQTPSMNETYTAMAQGLNPTYRFVLANYKDYDGQRTVRYNGQDYEVIRTYINDNNQIEITVDGGGRIG